MGRKPLPLSKHFSELDRREKDKAILPSRKAAAGHFGVSITKRGALKLAELSPEARAKVVAELGVDQMAAMLGVLPLEHEFREAPKVNLKPLPLHLPKANPNLSLLRCFSLS